jgi:3'-5' exoribonuclease
LPSLGQLPPVRELTAESAGTGFFLCTLKDVRVGKNGEFVSLVLQDATGRIAAKIFDGVDRLRNEFEAGEFVKVRARGNLYNDRLQLIVENIRRVNPDQDRSAGFKEEDCIPSAQRPASEMWSDLEALVARVKDPHIAALLARVIARFEDRLRIWPAAQTIHHAYRGGFLEHVLAIAGVAVALARAYGASEDLAIAGAVLHDIGKLEELDYDVTASYSSEGYLVGHITLGAIIVRDEAQAIDGFPPALLTEIEHLVVSHHGSREFGSPIEPMTVEAFILAAADDLDAKINQVRQAIQDDTGEAAFTAYHPRLKRVLWKG